MTPARSARGSRWPWLPTLVVLLLVDSGCANGIRLYDEPRSKLSTGIKEQYGNASILSTIEVEKKNLDRLLEEEIKVVRDNQQLRVDYALLRIADDSTPMAVTYGRAVRRLSDLGYPTIKDARASVLARSDAVEFRRELAAHAGIIAAIVPGVTPPDCVPGVTLPDTLSLPDELTTQNRARAVAFYSLYRTACTGLQEAEPTGLGGLAGQALATRRSAIAELAALDRTVEEAEKDVADKKRAHEQAKQAAAAPGSATTKDLQDKAKAAETALRDARSLAELIVARKHVQALVDLLTAAAGGTVDPKNPQVAAAATVAGSIPSLAGELKELRERGRAPSVSNLLVELRHQVVLLERARQLRAFAQQRADLAQAQYESAQAEVELWVRFTDAMCSFAFVAAGRPWPGRRCDNLKIETKTDPTTGLRTMTCTLAEPASPTPPELPAHCALVSSRWTEVVKNPGTSIATRELWKSLAAYVHALSAEGTQHELTFRLIDVRHREALVARESALRGWDNLVAVPVEQLEAYYRAGLKPAEIADLLVKALGLGAIAYGVSR